MDSASASSSSVSTKISPDGKLFIESCGGYGSGSKGDVEALWVEFDYFLETPKYVQKTLKSQDRIGAVESLMHDTLSAKLLGCELDNAFVYNNSEGGDHFATGMPRSVANAKRSDVVGLDLLTGVNTSPADVQIGMCEPRGIVNECRHMRAFVILNLRKIDDDDDDMSATKKMDETRVQLKEETKRIIEEACDRGDYNGKFVNEIFLAGVSFVKPEKEVTTLDHGYDQPLAGISGSQVESRSKMGKAEAYGIILLAGVAVILAAVAFLVTKTCRDARRRGYTERSHQKESGKKGGAKRGTAAWTDQIIEIESESDAEDLEVTLYLRSPRNASDPQKQGSSPISNMARSPISSPGICRAELHVRSPHTKKPAIPFDMYQKKAPADKKRSDKGDEETEATASISQITRSTSSFEQRLDHRKIEPIYEEEYEI